ncbi:MAG: hypothetical protein B6V02_01495 [Thermoprotei archaeon ex4572_64]|nr:MAG: hypothetical protein B6V02_01495 [Thermoprotei archaeon ex4572_64]
MVFVNWKITRDPFVNDVWTGVTEDIEGFYDPMLRTNLGEGKDTFSFKLTNFNDTLDNHFQVGDKITLRYGVNTLPADMTDDHIKMVGVITSLPGQEDGGANLLRVEGNNFSETLMNAITFINGDSLTIPNFLDQALQHIAAYNDKFRVTWHPGNKDVKTDGTAFPMGERWYNKSVKVLLEKYSSRKITEDVNYYWYVNNANQLVWRAQTEDVTYSFNKETEEYKAYKNSKDMKGIVNFLIIKANVSPKGNPISTRIDRAISRVKHGFKPKIITFDAKEGDNLVGLDGGVPDTFPFTTKWKSKVERAAAPFMTEGSFVTCDSLDEYDTAIIEQTKYLMIRTGNAYLDEHQHGKLSVELTFQPGKNWNIGDVISVTIPEIGKSNNAMRVRDAEYSTTTERYTLVEDEGTL